MDLLFPFAAYWWVYAAFTAGVLAVLAVDLGVFHRQAHAVTFRESLAWSAVWVALAMAVNYGFYRYALAEFGGDVAARVEPATASLYIVNPLTGGSLASLFSTHPPMEERIARLRALLAGGRRVA